MNNIKYFKPLTPKQLAQKTEEAYKQLSYHDMLQAIINIEEAPAYREPLIKEVRKLLDKPEKTPLESVLMMVLFNDLQADISYDSARSWRLY